MAFINLKRLWTGLTMILLFSGCAGLQPGWETPVVNITSFKPVPTQEMVPRFKIGLHVVNPNRTPLILKGIAYTIEIEGHKVMTGVSNNLPEIPEYGEGDILLDASMDLFGSIGFFADLMRNHQREQIRYKLNAKLDAGTLHPIIRVSKEGEFSLAPSVNKRP